MPNIFELIYLVPYHGILTLIRNSLQHLVRPQLDYASAVWDPHTKERITQIEKVQRRAARWTVNNFDRQASETKII